MGAAGARRELERRLGHAFADGALLDRALTHASARSTDGARLDNERLEFLGDRVLGLAAAEALFERFPQATEGELARGLNRLVRGETCAQVARRIGLGPFIVLSAGEAEGGGREKTTILADAIEAVLGAAFLDAGYAPARDMVRLLWREEIEQISLGAADAKSALQEWAQGRGLALPEYVEIGRIGPDHAPRFTSEVRLAGSRSARGEGDSKRAAEQAAASEMLRLEGVREETAPDG